jgi:predicted RNase H-like nuclease (RuvC/YqgF family)
MSEEYKTIIELSNKVEHLQKQNQDLIEKLKKTNERIDELHKEFERRKGQYPIVSPPYSGWNGVGENKKFEVYH